MAKRVYLVTLKKKKVLVEATSQETAIRAATANQVVSCIIPSPIEVARLMREGVETIGETISAKEETQEPAGEPTGEGVGSMGIKPADAE